MPINIKLSSSTPGEEEEGYYSAIPIADGSLAGTNRWDSSLDKVCDFFQFYFGRVVTFKFFFHP